MPDVASLSVVIDADTKGLEAGLARAQQSVSSAGSAIQAAMGGALIAGVAGLGAAMVGSVKSAADFEKQMSAVGAVAGASASEMEALTKTALQLGKDTSFSASEAAQGIEELVKAGVSVADVMGGGARAALDLAAAGAISVADAAEIASNALNVFNLSGSDMGHVADVIAGAANASAIGVNDFKFSLSAAGAVAATVGISFESLSEAIAVMGNAGIKGSDAGTSLKTMMMNLIPTTNKQMDLFRDLGITTFNAEKGMAAFAKLGLDPARGAMEDAEQQLKKLVTGWDGTKKMTQEQEKAWAKAAAELGIYNNHFFDAEGKAKSFAEISEVLREALKGMTKEQQLATLEIMFGSDAIRAGAVLLEAGAQGFTEMAEAMGKVTAQQVANERLNNLWGSVEKLKGSLETAAIILGSQFTPALKRMADAAADQVNAVIDAFEQIPDAIETVKQVIAGEWAPDDSIRPFTLAVGEAAVMVRDTFGPAITVVGGILQQLSEWFQANIAPIAAFVAGFLGAIAAAGLLSAAISAIAAVLALLLSPLGLVAIAVGLLAAAWVTNFLGIQEVTAAFWAFLQPVLVQLVDWLGPKIMAVLTWLTTTGWPAMLAAGQAVAAWITGTAIPAITQLVDWLGPRLSAVVTWIYETGWPALVTAGTAVVAIVTQIIQFFTNLFTVLEQRGVFTELQTMWTALVGIGTTLAGIITSVAGAFKPLFDIIASILQAQAALLIQFFTDLTAKAGGAAGVVDTMAKALQGFFAIINSQLAMLKTFLDYLDRLTKFQMPSFNFGGGGGGGAQTLSYTGARTAGGSLAAVVPGGRGGFTTGGTHTGGSAADVFAAIGTPIHAPVGGQSSPLTDVKGGNATILRGDDGRWYYMAHGSVPFQGGRVEAGQQIGQVGDTGNARGTSPHLHISVSSTGNFPGGQGDLTIPQNAPQDINKLMGVAGPLSDVGPLPPFMDETFKMLPEYLQSLETIKEQGTETYTQVATTATEQGQALVSASTDALGNVTRIYSEAGVVIGATITNAAGQIVNAWGAMATGVVENTNLMASGALTSVTNLGTGVLTTVQTTAGTTIATVTDMAGQVTAQHATMANGATLAANGLQEGVLTSVTQMHDGTITSVQDMAGNVIVTVTDLQGNVTNQYTQMASSAASTASATSDALGEIVSAAEEVPPVVKTMADSWKNLPRPNVSGIVSAFEDIAEAAEDAADEVDKLADKTGVRSGSGKKNILGKAAGGPVDFGETYLVGEQGPELFTPSRSGYIVPNDGLGGGIDYDQLERALARSTARPNITVTGVGLDDVAAEIVWRLRSEESLRGGI